MSELIDIVDKNGDPTGEAVEREYAHQNGIWHRTAHLWLVRVNNGKFQVLLQKRAANKDSHPGCYDISSAGHIPAGVDYKPSAIRELKEELGVDAKEDDLVFCGNRTIVYDDYFHGKSFRDRQHSKVYLLWLDLPEENFIIDKNELDSILWIDLDQCCHLVENNLFQHCISPEELQMLRRKLYQDQP